MHQNPEPGSDSIAYRAIPSVHKLLESPVLVEWSSRLPHEWVANAARKVLDGHRLRLADDPKVAAQTTMDELSRDVAKTLQIQTARKLRAVINATGIILHTGLGRAPLAKSATEALVEAAENYASVEIDLKTGQRSQRVEVVEDLVCQLTGAEAAAVVNNNAAAMLIVFAVVVGHYRPRKVVVSRGELIEIGGSYRLPQVMESSGAVLDEVGTTNRTHLLDYEQAITYDTAALLSVHTSNYRVQGFCKSVSIQELVGLGKRHAVPVIHDIGSGLISSELCSVLAEEPSAQESIQAGADLVLFSGDKLLGGPQSGIIVGRRHWINQIRHHPLMRAMRVDKLTLAALEATLRLHHDPVRASNELPVLTMVQMSVERLQERARRIVDRLGSIEGLTDVTIRSSMAYLGGGSLPAEAIESVSVCLRSREISEAELARRLRVGSAENDSMRQFPIICHVQNGAVWLDLRTVFPDQDEMLVTTVVAVV